MIQEFPWTQNFYEIVENIYWKPQKIGRQGGKAKDSWPVRREALSRDEEHLQFMLNTMIQVLPPKARIVALDAAFGITIPGDSVSLVDLPATTNRALHNYAQPDMHLEGPAVRMFVEVKTRPSTEFSLTQLQKQIVAMASLGETNQRRIMVHLSNKGRSHRWKKGDRPAGASMQGLGGGLAELSGSGLRGKASATAASGLEAEARALAKSIATSGFFRDVTWQDFGENLREHVEEESNPFISAICEPFLAELEARSLWTPGRHQIDA